MNKFFSLTKVLLKNSFSSFGTGKNKKFKTTAYLLLVLFSLIPIPVGVATFTSVIYELLSGSQQQLLLIQFGFTSVSLLLLVISVFFVVSVFYFASDLDFLLPLPLKASEIVSSKFIVTMIYLYFVVALYSAPLVISFGVKSSAGILYYIYALVIVIFMPLIPLAVTSMLSMFLMKYVNITKKKDQFRIIISIAGIAVIIGLNYFTNSFLNTQNPQEALEILKNGRSTFIQVSTSIFPSINYAISALSESDNPRGFLYLNAFLCINFLFYLLFMKVSEKLYLKGAVGNSEVFSDATSISIDKINSSSGRNHILKAYAIKEIKILFRTPAFFLNCVLINFLWPVFFFIAFANQNGGLAGILNFLNTGNSQFKLIIISLGAGMFISASNGITASAISREGNNFYVNKYLPIPNKFLVIAKLLPGIILSSIVAVLIIISAGIFAGLPLLIIFISSVAAITGSLFGSITGLFFDLHFPKLIWDNEYKAVKQNMNVLINILINVSLATGLVIVQSVFSFTILHSVMIILIVFLVEIFLYYNLYTGSKKLFDEIDV